MAIAPSDGEVASDAARLRRIGDDVFAGLEVSEDERWFGTGQHSAPPSPVIEASRTFVIAVFPTEEDAMAALLALQPRIEARLGLALSSFDGGWPRDRRSVLAVRGADGHVAEVAAIVAECGGTLISRHANR